MTATAYENTVITTVDEQMATAPRAVGRSPAWPLTAALRLEAAAALAFSVAVSSVAAGHPDAEVTGIRLVAGGAMLVAIFAFALGRHVRLGRRWSYNASGLLQVLATVGIIGVGLLSGSVALVLALLAAPAIVMLAMCHAGVRDALGQNQPPSQR
jgi:hypothetical protein